jgi:RHS repeat-associated protein
MTAGYTHNGNGQRVKKIVNGVATIFHYSLNGQLIAESNSAGATTAEYVYLNGAPLAKIEGTEVYYYHNDHLATPQKMTDSTGAVVWSADYKPFGEATITVSTITNNLRFPGQYFDAETGLNYNYFRDYNPVIGKYIQADVIGMLGGLNLFVYTNNNPVNGIDPYGLSSNTVAVQLPRYYPLIPPLIAALAPVIAPVIVPAGVAVIAGGIIFYPSSLAEEPIDQPLERCEPKKKKCPPCILVDGTIVPLGTIACRSDILPLDRVQHGIPGSHLNLYKANQNPNNCRCFWQPSGTVPPPPQPGWIPIQPFMN